jgi:hypothetical protein
MGTIIFHWVCIGLNAFQLLGNLLQVGTVGLGGLIAALPFLAFNVAIAGAIIYILQQPQVRQAFRPGAMKDEAI